MTVFSHFCIPETRGKTMQQIQHIFHKEEEKETNRI